MDVQTKVALRAQNLRIASNVARRVLARGVALGKTLQNEKVRIHRYSNVIKITDLTNAGTRGKKVEELAVGYEGFSDMSSTSREVLEIVSDLAGNLFLSGNDYQSIKSYMEKLKKTHDGIDIEVRNYRGVDVEPFGETFDFLIKGDMGATFRVRFSPHDFTVKHTRPTGPKGVDLDTFYYSQTKADGQAWYAWASKNQLLIRRFKSINDFMNVWAKLKVRWGTH
jgi:hypothetical protein